MCELNENPDFCNCMYCCICGECHEDLDSNDTCMDCGGTDETKTLISKEKITMKEQNYIVTIEGISKSTITAKSKEEAIKIALKQYNIDQSKPYSFEINHIFNDHTALEQTFELWNYLAGSGADQKIDLNTTLSFDPTDYNNNCPLCEYLSNTLNLDFESDGCLKCPMFDFWNSFLPVAKTTCPCDQHPSPYEQWRNSSSKHTRQIAATKIAAGALDELENY